LDLGLDECNRRKALAAYSRGKVSIGRAAEIAGVSIAEFYKILEHEDIPIKIDIKGIERSLELDFGK
jgi:predicted HTH domain antitoxin